MGGSKEKNEKGIKVGMVMEKIKRFNIKPLKEYPMPIKRFESYKVHCVLPYKETSNLLKTIKEHKIILNRKLPRRSMLKEVKHKVITRVLLFCLVLLFNMETAPLVSAQQKFGNLPQYLKREHFIIYHDNRILAHTLIDKAEHYYRQVLKDLGAEDFDPFTLSGIRAVSLFEKKHLDNIQSLYMFVLKTGYLYEHDNGKYFF